MYLMIGKRIRAKSINQHCLANVNRIIGYMIHISAVNKKNIDKSHIFQSIRHQCYTPSNAHYTTLQILGNNYITVVVVAVAVTADEYPRPSRPLSLSAGAAPRDL